MGTNNQTSSECFTNPCHYSTCEAFPHAKCEVDACSPCSVVRFTSGTREVTDICSKHFHPFLFFCNNVIYNNYATDSAFI